MDISYHRPIRTQFVIRTTREPEKLGLGQKESEKGRFPEEAGAEAPDSRQDDGSDSQGLYVISVAARLLAMHPQTLRKYERAGLVMPSRTMGMLRLYSESDIIRLRLIKHLVDDLRLNLAGVTLALSLVDSLMALASQMGEMGMEQIRETLDQQISEILEL